MLSMKNQEEKLDKPDFIDDLFLRFQYFDIVDQVLELYFCQISEDEILFHHFVSKPKRLVMKNLTQSTFWHRIFWIYLTGISYLWSLQFGRVS